MPVVTANSFDPKRLLVTDQFPYLVYLAFVCLPVNPFNLRAAKRCDGRREREEVHLCHETR